MRISIILTDYNLSVIEDDEEEMAYVDGGYKTVITLYGFRTIYSHDEIVELSTGCSVVNSLVPPELGMWFQAYGYLLGLIDKGNGVTITQTFALTIPILTTK